MLQLGRKRKLRHFVTAKSEELQALKSKVEEEQELFEAYALRFIGGLNTDPGYEKFWLELTKPQQVLAALNIFVSQVNNGGVWQFFFNRREFAVVVGEALDETYRLSPILTMYEKVLREFARMNSDGRWQELVNSLGKVKPESPESWQIFVAGKESIPHAEEFDTLFFEPKIRTRMFSSFNRYIEQNLDKMLQIEAAEKTSKGSEKTAKSDSSAIAVKKKYAIPHFSTYLKEQYGLAPEDVSVYYTGKVTIDSQPAQLFLMRYKLPNGFEGMGITGHFTLHLPELTFAEVNKMRKQHHKQKLVNTFYGAYLVQKTLAENPKAAEMEPGLWENFISKIQAQTGGQIPVNVTLLEYFTLKDYEVVIYKGDLLYYRKSAEPPKDPQKVSTDKKSGFAGETDLIFHADPRGESFGGRGQISEPVEATYKLYAMVGRKFKLLKDNPWGF